MDLDKLRKSSGGRRKFSLPSLPRLSRNSSASAGAHGARGGRGRRQAFGAVHFKKEKTFKQAIAAIEKLDANRLEELITGIDYGELDDNGSLLHKAVRQDSLELVNILLSHGAPVNTSAGDDSSPLHVAARQGSVPMASLLLSHGADVHARTKFERRTPLHLAALAGSDEVARMLVGAGAEKDATDIYGSPPLHLAARGCHVEVVSFLLESGVNVQWYDKEGWTSLHLAAEGGHCVIASLLLGANANIDAQTKYGRTALHWACMKQHQEVGKLLLSDGASVDIKDLHNKTADRYVVGNLPELVIALRKAQKGARSISDTSTSIGTFVELAVERESPEKRRERKKADVLSVIPNSPSASMMSVIVEEEEVLEATDDVDDGFVSQHDTSSPQLSSEAEVHVELQLSTAKKMDLRDETCSACDALNVDRTRKVLCTLHRVQDNSTDLQRMRNRVELNFSTFASTVDHITRQVTRAMDSDERAANLLCDTFPTLRTLRSKLEAYQSDLISDLVKPIAELEDIVAELHCKQSETELKIPRKVKLVQRFCQSVATALTQENLKAWMHLLKVLPIERHDREKIKQKVKSRKYASECANVHEVLLLFLEHRNGDMTLFIKTVLDAMELDDDIAKYKDDIITLLVSCLAGENGSCPNRATIAAVADSLSERAIADIAREIGMTTDKLQSIKRLSSAAGESSEQAEIISSFLHAADDLPIFDKLRILSDALVFVKREDLLMVLYEQ